MPRPRRSPRRLRRDRGAAMVEMTFVLPVLVILMTGIIAFGLAMNQKQDVTRVAAEAARVGAVALPGSASSADFTSIGVSPNPAAETDARALAAARALDDAVKGSFTSNGCSDATAADGSPGCEVAIGPCDGQGTERCVTVVFAYSEGLPLRHLPFVGRVIPDELRARSVARVNEAS